MSTINTVAAGLNHAADHSGTSFGVVAEGSAVKQSAEGVPIASPMLSASTVVTLGAASAVPLTYDASLTRSVENLRVGIARYLGYGA
jgi:hypothetical protein